MLLPLPTEYVRDISLDRFSQRVAALTTSGDGRLDTRLAQNRRTVCRRIEPPIGVVCQSSAAAR